MKTGMNSNLMKSEKKVKKLIIKVNDYRVMTISRTCHEIYSSMSVPVYPPCLSLPHEAQRLLVGAFCAHCHNQQESMFSLLQRGTLFPSHLPLLGSRASVISKSVFKNRLVSQFFIS